MMLNIIMRVIVISLLAKIFNELFSKSVTSHTVKADQKKIVSFLVPTFTLFLMDKKRTISPTFNENNPFK